MKTLKESILSRSSHGGEGFKAQRRESIEKWLDKYEIKNYTIKDDFTIDVDGDVDICTINLKEFPEYIQFDIVKRDFNCELNQLISLRGAPREVGRDFYCSLNELTSLEGAPKKVGGDFDCFRNNLTSLKGCPREIGGNFSCNHNNLTSLEGAPRKVGGKFECDHNHTQFIDDDVREVCNVKGKIRVR